MPRGNAAAGPVVGGRKTADIFQQFVSDMYGAGNVTRAASLLAEAVMAESDAIDWGKVAGEYRAGTRRVKDIARDAGVSIGALYLRAEREGWAKRSDRTVQARAMAVAGVRGRSGKAGAELMDDAPGAATSEARASGAGRGASAGGCEAGKEFATAAGQPRLRRRRTTGRSGGQDQPGAMPAGPGAPAGGTMDWAADDPGDDCQPWSSEHGHSPRAGRPRRHLSVRRMRARMLEVLTNQLEQLAAINERHPNDGALSERSARAMATIVNAIDKLIELEIKGGGTGKEPDPEQNAKLLHIMRAELAERLGCHGARGEADGA